MPRTILRTTLAVALCLGLSLGAVPSAVARATHDPVSAARSDVAPRTVPALRPALRAVLRKVNAARARHDLAPMGLGTCLTRKFAQPWARHLAETGTLVHQDLSPMLRRCPGFSRVGENIAYGYPTAAAVMKAWMHSPGHRRNILGPGYTRIGLGLATSEDGTRYWVQDFGG